MLDQPFYDDVHRWTFASKGSMQRVAGDLSPQLLNYRRLIRGAQRFVVDDSLMAHMVQLSNTPDHDQFSYWSILARLPYDVMWLEWDQHERLRISERLGKLEHPFDPSEVSQPNGMLLVRDLESTSKWVMYAFARETSGEVFVNPLVMVFDPDGRPPSFEGATRMSELGNITPLSALRQPPLCTVLDMAPGTEYSVLGYRSSNNRTFGVPEWGINRVGLMEEPIWRQFRKERQRQGADMQKVSDPYVEQMYENRGMLRSVVALLAMINNVPRMERKVAARPGYRPSGANRVSYLDHHTITLQLPKSRQLEYIQQRMRLGYGRYRRHDVRGFYRRVTNDRLGIRCHHIPTADSTSDRITCGRCGSQIRWVNEFQRGDASLGHVQKTYKLKTSHVD